MSLPPPSPVPGARRERASHDFGLAVTIAGFVVFSPDALLIRLIGLDPWTLVFWRCLLVTLFLGAFTWARAGRGGRRQLFTLGKPGLLVALLSAFSNVCFVLALTHADVADALVVVSIAPLFAALLSRAALHEAVATSTWATIALVLGATGWLFAGSAAKGSLAGTLTALASALAIAAITVIIRQARAVSMLPAVVWGDLIAAVAAGLVAAALSRPFTPAPCDWAPLVVMGGLVLPLGLGLVTAGPRYLPAAEVNLLSLAETILGPLWVWWALGEAPRAATLGAAGIIVPALALHSWLARRRARSERGAVPGASGPPRAKW